MKRYLILLWILAFQLHAYAQTIYKFQTKFNDAIPVLNIGTFHMGLTTDANSLNFDEHNQNNINQIHAIARQIATFKPTIILIERDPSTNQQTQKQYLEYLNNPAIKFEKPSEIELLAFEVGRLSMVSKIYGIDYEQSYFYQLNSVLKIPQDIETFSKYAKLTTQNAIANNLNPEKMSVKELLRLNNQPEYLDYLINVNADLLMNISVNGYPLGTEQASKFYNRNLMIFSNLNNIALQKDDRIFILMGATHTAFFKDFLRRSPKFIEVNSLDYLK